MRLSICKIHHLVHRYLSSRWLYALSLPRLAAHSSNRRQSWLTLTTTNQNQQTWRWRKTKSCQLLFDFGRLKSLGVFPESIFKVKLCLHANKPDSSSLSNVYQWLSNKTSLSKNSVLFVFLSQSTKRICEVTSIFIHIGFLVCKSNRDPICCDHYRVLFSSFVSE